MTTIIKSNSNKNDENNSDLIKAYKSTIVTYIITQKEKHLSAIILYIFIIIYNLFYIKLSILMERGIVDLIIRKILTPI